MSDPLDTTNLNAEYRKLVGKKASSTDKANEKEILKGIPSGVWADQWATKQEERGRSFSGQDLISVAPKPPKRARDWARKVADKIIAANPWAKTLEDLYRHVHQNGYPHDRDHFGYHLGMQAVGHGVSWSDDTPKLSHSAIKIPLDEFY